MNNLFDFDGAQVGSASTIRTLSPGHTSRAGRGNPPLISGNFLRPHTNGHAYTISAMLVAGATQPILGLRRHHHP